MKSKFRVFTVMMACFGSLIVVSLGLIIAINFATSVNIFSRMLGQTVVRSVEGLELALQNHLDAAVNQADFIVENLGSGNISFDRPEVLANFASGSLAAAPQITGLLVANDQGRVIRTRRTNLGSAEWELIDAEPGSRFGDFNDDMRGRKTAFWAAPVYQESLQAAIFSYRVPIWRDDTYAGYVAVAISTRALSDFVAELSDPPASQVFLLYGEDRVLAHSHLVLQNSMESVEQPLLSVDDIHDPIIQQLDFLPSDTDFLDLEGADLTEVDFEDQNYGVVTKPVTTYGETPIIIGAYFDGSGIESLLISILRAILIGLVILLVGLGVVLWLSRVITRPVRQTAEVASAIAALDFEGVDPLPQNRIREIDDLATAFNGMLAGLKSFGRYVPRNLVRQLIRENSDGAGIEERELTVMFTDIAGFTTACEGMSPPDVAEFINHHLTLVSNCIEKEGGTIDKYIGDAVMAFWGAPDSIDNQTLRAVRAAAALQIALAEDNRKRARANLPVVRIRIGIHTGPLIVGDIGSPDRINYTVIGDVVNTTQRLEALGKDVDPDAESIVLVSRPVKDRVGDEMKLDEIGQMKVKGRQGGVEVYRLSENA
ncbi:adenylate/guanylate cyclase domain-containing protein [Aliiroseovarius sp. YM-037]|uniref:adenylate/guanylate cyclase domain-containing protein n=1 Tax=Aliiroseovarius sp. YM-037 TaxID=3341728 RepID=UPI003A80F4C7